MYGVCRICNDDGNCVLTQDNDTRRAVANLLVLSAAELNHGLCSRVSNVDFTQNGISVVGQDDSAHWVEKHFEHCARAEAGADDVGDGL